MAMNPEDLESALNNARSNSSEAPVQNSNQGNSAPQLSAEEEIGFHKGAINTLVAERNELVKMISNVEAIMQAHIQRLKEFGIDVTNGKKN